MIAGRIPLIVDDMQGQTLTVAIDPVFTGRFWIRYRLAICLIRLAGLVMRVQVRAYEEEQ